MARSSTCGARDSRIARVAVTLAFAFSLPLAFHDPKGFQDVRARGLCRRIHPAPQSHLEELETVFEAHGVHTYSIFLDPDDQTLFAYVEVKDEERWDAITETEVCQQWWHSMRDLMPTNPDDSPKSTDLKEVFHFD